MGKQNKKPGSSKKKSKKSTSLSSTGASSSAAVFDLESIIQTADQSLESSDLDTALQLYQYAVKELQSQLVDHPSNTATEKKVEDTIMGKMFTLVKIFSKMGEIQVSMIQPESAKQSFLEALQILSSITKDTKHKVAADDNTPTPPPTITTTTNVDKKLYMETQAGIQLYIAQLSQGEDALEYFQYGIQSLILLLQDLQRNTTSDMKMHEEEKEDSEIHGVVADTNVLELR